MGDCKYCGQPAGFLRTKHPGCEEKYNYGWAEMVSTARAALNSSSLSALQQRLTDIAASYLVPKDLVRSALITAWTEAVDTSLSDQLLTADEEHALVAFQREFALSQAELDRTGAFMRLGKAAVLRDVVEGKVPQRVAVDGYFPFNLQKTESLIWMFNGVDYFETRTHTQYVGRSAGFSIRVARGIYYRTGAFHGRPIQSSEVVHAGHGPLAVTNKDLYYSGGQKSLRIPFNKIVTFQEYSDGIGVQRDAASAKPQVFRTGDGWFTYNLITNAAHL